MKNKFSLIELLVVISIIGILASLLLPMLAKSRSAAKASVCTSQLKQIGTASYMYTSDNNGLFQRAKSDNNHISWGDLTAPYLGINSTESQKSQYGLLKTDGVGGTDLFLCPSDELTPLHDTYVKSTYSMNQSGWAAVHRGGDGYYWGISATDWSRNITSIEDASGTIAFSEYVHEQNYFGRDNNLSRIRSLNEQTSSTFGLHTGKSKFSYLFTDGHVEIRTYLSTMGAGNMADPRGAWTYIND